MFDLLFISGSGLASPVIPFRAYVDRSPRLSNGYFALVTRRAERLESLMA